MAIKEALIKIKRYHQRLNGSTITYSLAPYQNILRQIDNLKFEFQEKSDETLKNISRSLMNRARNHEILDNLLVDAFALVRETVWRVLNVRPFDSQIIGGIVMHQGKLAEMQTGEGKTLTAIFPAYLNGLSGKGVHVLTFNDYLAYRDAQWMGPVYQYLGMAVGCIQEGMGGKARQKAYRSDITYLTVKESGFDFLRDSLRYSQADMVHRDFNYAILDEADSILIDEARVPLIIAEATDDAVADPYQLAKIVRQLEKDDVGFDDHARTVYLTEEGLSRVEGMLNCPSLYEAAHIDLLTRLNCALHAQFLLSADIDYIVRNGKVELVDEFTGRIADKRRWPDGLQAAIEAKENLAVQPKGIALNSISLQHFLQLYPEFCGMTATARTAEQEFREFYNLHIVVIPPAKPCIRKDAKDVICRSKNEKYEVIIEEIVQSHRTKRPILVGTQSIEESVGLADILRQKGLTCEVLNAKRDAFEAGIIAEAGKLSAITISTNMAGRGTDIRLGGADEHEKKQVAALGGLYVIGTKRHESQRIDNQLRGRAGRQGDPGSSRFFISLEDDIFEKYRLKDLLRSHDRFIPQRGNIDDPFVRGEVNRIQRIIEGQNLEIKKTMCSYSSLLDQQRQVIFRRRKSVLLDDSFLEFFRSNSPDRFHTLASTHGKEKLLEICRRLTLRCLDQSWSRYLNQIEDIREGIHLTRIGGRDPVSEFRKQSIKLFDAHQGQIEFRLIQAFDAACITETGFDAIDMGLRGPSATITYLVNDNPFENMLEMQLTGNIGFSMWAGFLWPLTLSILILRKLFWKRE